MGEPLMTIEELAQELALAKATLREWCWQRRIPFVKLGRLVRFRRAEIEAWLAQQAVEPRQPLAPLPDVLARRVGGRPRPRS